MIDHHPRLVVRNLNALPRGTGCRYLRCVVSHEPGVLIAKSWHRKEPAAKRGEEIVQFGARKEMP